MPRATNAPASRERRRRRLDDAKGFRGSRSKLFRLATEAVNRAQRLHTIHRHHRKRDFRRLWIARINAATIRVEAGLIADRTDDDPALETCVAELNVRIQRILLDLYREQIAAEPRQ